MVKWLMNTDNAVQQNCENLEYWSDEVMGNKTNTPILHHYSTPLNRAFEDARFHRETSVNLLETFLETNDSWPCIDSMM